MTEPHLTGRRRELVAAAVAVVARSGLRGLTHRAVDAQAGLSEGSCSAYYRTRAALLEALTTYVGLSLTERVRALGQELDTVGDGAARQARIADWFVELFGDSDLLRVQSELALEAQRQPELAEHLRPWRDQLLSLVEAILVARGNLRPREQALVIVSALLGVLTWSLVESPDKQRRAVELTLEALTPSIPL